MCYSIKIQTFSPTKHTQSHVRTPVRGLAPPGGSWSGRIGVRRARGGSGAAAAQQRAEARRARDGLAARGPRVG